MVQVDNERSSRSFHEDFTQKVKIIGEEEEDVCGSCISQVYGENAVRLFFKHPTTASTISRVIVALDPVASEIISSQPGLKGLEWIGSGMIGNRSFCRIFQMKSEGEKLVIAVLLEEQQNASSSLNNGKGKAQWEFAEAIVSSFVSAESSSCKVHILSTSNSNSPNTTDNIFQLSSSDSNSYFPVMEAGQMLSGLEACFFSYCKVRSLDCTVYVCCLEGRLGQQIVSRSLLQALEPLLISLLPFDDDQSMVDHRRSGFQAAWDRLLSLQDRKNRISSHPPLYL